MLRSTKHEAVDRIRREEVSFSERQF